MNKENSKRTPVSFFETHLSLSDVSVAKIRGLSNFSVGDPRVKLENDKNNQFYTHYVLLIGICEG